MQDINRSNTLRPSGARTIGGAMMGIVDFTVKIMVSDARQFDWIDGSMKPGTSRNFLHNFYTSPFPAARGEAFQLLARVFGRPTLAVFI